MNEEIAVLLSLERLQTTMRHSGRLVKETVLIVVEKDLVHVGGVVRQQVQRPVRGDHFFFDVNDSADGMRQVSVRVGCQFGTSPVRANAVRSRVVEAR